MKAYHPMASAVDAHGNEIKLFVQDSADTLEQCVKQFEIWEEYGYQIKKAVVQILENNTVKTVEFKKTWIPCTEELKLGNKTLTASGNALAIGELHGGLVINRK